MCRDGAVLFLTYFRLTISVKISSCRAAIEIASILNPDPMVVIIFTVQHSVCVCVVPRLFPLVLLCIVADAIESEREKRE